MEKHKLVCAALGALLLAAGATGALFLFQGSSDVARGEPPVSGTPEFPSLDETTLEQAWGLAESVGWVATLHAQGGERVSARPITDHGALVGVLLVVSYSATIALPGPWLLDACGPNSVAVWAAPELRTVGYLAAVDLEASRLVRLLPLNIDGQFPSKADLQRLGGAVELPAEVVPIADFLSLLDCAEPVQG